MDVAQVGVTTPTTPGTLEHTVEGAEAELAQVQIELEGRKVPVTAEQLHGAEREAAWQQIVTAAPRFAKYQQKTDRELPIIRLTPQSAPEAG